MPQLLWIEDDARQLKHYVAPLERAGWAISIAGSAKEAFEALDAIESYDVVLLDLLLPSKLPEYVEYDHPGIAILEHVRRDLDSRIPVVVFTVVWTPGELDKVQALGVNAILSKPVVQRRLMQAVYDAIGEELPEPEKLPAEVPDDWR
ncbi:MAG: response regulator [Coriobacteriia bacterium]|nr:response regulator [Coriobacteriia bacterium]